MEITKNLPGKPPETEDIKNLYWAANQEIP